ncbi:MAG: hypothetical protein LBP31_03415 [Holosporales bacterium]|jgi:hypothetical protein|nr:hypothetical protein [Holosporales bacterium]
MRVFLIAKLLVFGSVSTVLPVHVAHSTQFEFFEPKFVTTYTLNAKGNITDAGGNEVEYEPVDQDPEVVAKYTEKVMNKNNPE